MDNRALLGLSLLILLISVKLTATAKEDSNAREQRGIFLNTLATGTNFLTLFQNYTTQKLIKTTSLLTTILNTTTGNPFKIKKLALLSILVNSTADLITPKTNITNFKLLSKIAALSNSTSFGLKSIFNTSAIFLTDLLTAKLALKNSTLAAKLQFANASAIALQSAVDVKANKTASKLTLLNLLNTTTLNPLLANKIAKKNLTLLLSDELLQFYNLTAIDIAGKFNKTFLKSNDEYSYDDEIQDRDDYQVQFEFEYV